jgi:putative transposase
MRRSRFTRSEILQLLAEASAGVSVADICSSAGINPRTFYRWRRQFGGLGAPVTRQMKDLISENARLRGLVNNLFELLRASAADVPDQNKAKDVVASGTGERTRDQTRASRIAAEKCGGALIGHFASIRINR